MRDVSRTLPEEILITGGSIYDPATGKSRKSDIGIKQGVLVAPDAVQTGNATSIDATGCIITHGLIDIHVHFREPGREDKENLQTGARAALAGGFTRVCMMPNTEPPIDSPEIVRFLLEKGANLPVQINVIGAITREQKGLELAELLEMYGAGAVAFSDDGMPVENGQLLRNALLYTRDLGIPVINHAEDTDLRADGVVNQGALSTRLGLPGNPVEAEAAMIHRDLLLAGETDARLHVPHVSTALAVELIRGFKEQGARVTAEATPHHLGLTEDALTGFDTNAKVAPPLRTEKDRQAIVAALADGTIDCIATDHAPHTVDEKERDMIHAPFGMIGLDSAVGMAFTVLRQAGLTAEQIIDLFTSGPAGVMGMELTPIEEGAPVELVIIDPDEHWTYGPGDIYSRSRNTAMLGMDFTGKVHATITSQGWFCRS